MKESQAKIDSIRHSLAHLLAMAVLKKFPKAKLGIGPVIENGFYYDFQLPRPISDADLPEFEKTMRDFIAQKLVFTGEKVTPQKVRALFKSQPFKLDLIKEFTKEKQQLTVYHTCTLSKPYTPNPKPCFTDLCRGGHVKNTSDIDPDAFKLTKIAGAYWRGSEKNPQLTRIYGVAFATKQELDLHTKMLEEAERRDHKRLGSQLDLFTFSDLVGPGLPLWTPKGTIVRNILDHFVWRLRKPYGFERVEIPHIAKKELYAQSGHWDKFKEELFKITSREGHLFVIKPMNCPHHIELFRRKAWSWRELPVRYATTTTCYRDEQTGELSGLSRARAFNQDDSHTFFRKRDVKKIVLENWEIVESFYRAVGLPLTIRLSLRDPKKPKQYLGSPKLWEEAEEQLRAIAREKRAEAAEVMGEAAFYGPKVDFIAKDSLGRQWQVATIQLDMNLPERFDLTCTNEQGQKERLVMAHVAIMGSIERLLSILIEHYAGAFPTWLAPVQVAVLPVSEKFAEYGRRIFETLGAAGMRVELHDANDTLSKRIREAELQKIPYILVIGEREAAAKTVAVRERDKGDQGQMTLVKFSDIIKEKLSEM